MEEQHVCGHPILTCDDALAFEQRLLPSEEAQWGAMRQAGRALGQAIIADYHELGHMPEHVSILILVGKGHNGGDALLAAAEVCQYRPHARVCVLLTSPIEECRELTQDAYKKLEMRTTIRRVSLSGALNDRFDICIDGLLGMQFKPPLRGELKDIIEAVNCHRHIGFRVAVDLPSGIGDGGFQADFTYATGIMKTPMLMDAKELGRVRYLDIGFFNDKYIGDCDDFTLHFGVLSKLRGLRNPRAEKRVYGHLFIVAGSRSMPGALLMNAKAAVQSGVGLVTAFAPESVAGQYTAALPEVMWVPFPETPEGGLALEGRHLIRERISRATAILTGSGLGREPETQQLVQDLVSETNLPVILDADALSPDVLNAVAKRQPDAGAVIASPHLGEYRRMSDNQSDAETAEGLRDFAKQKAITCILKGPLTRVSDGSCVFYNPFGGPVLARGGSGDILAGMLGSLAAQSIGSSLEVATTAVVWHGFAADLLARKHGHVAVRTTELLNYLNVAIR